VLRADLVFITRLRGPSRATVETLALLVDDGGTIHAVNDRALTRFGYEAQGLTGTAWDALLALEPGDLGAAG
jgi:PAS domain-containing protein